MLSIIIGTGKNHHSPSAITLALCMPVCVCVRGVHTRMSEWCITILLFLIVAINGTIWGLCIKIDMNFKNSLIWVTVFLFPCSLSLQRQWLASFVKWTCFIRTKVFLKIKLPQLLTQIKCPFLDTDATRGLEFPCSTQRPRTNTVKGKLTQVSSQQNFDRAEKIFAESFAGLM